MANFSYKAADKAGRTVQGSLEADSRRQAVALLRTRGLMPLEISADEASGKKGRPGLLHALREKLLRSLSCRRCRRFSTRSRRGHLLNK